MTQQYGSKLKGERMLSVRETAEIMGWCLDSVRRKLRSGQMPGVRVGRSWRVPESQLASFIGVDRISDPEPAEDRRSAGSSGWSKSSELDYVETDSEVVDVLLRTHAARTHVLKLVKRALINTDVAPDQARQTLSELGNLLRTM